MLGVVWGSFLDRVGIVSSSLWGSCFMMFGLCWGRFLMTLGSCWGYFGNAFGSCWDRRGSSWVHPGIILLLFWYRFDIILGAVLGGGPRLPNA